MKKPGKTFLFLSRPHTLMICTVIVLTLIIALKFLVIFRSGWIPLVHIITELLFSVSIFVILILIYFDYKRKHAELLLKDSLNLFKDIVDNTPEGILVAESGSKKFFISNKKICQMLGYSREELSNMTVADIHPAESLDYVIKSFEKLLNNEILIINDIPVQRKDGALFNVDIAAYPATIAGKLYLFGIFRENTDRKHIEDALLKNEALINTLFNGTPAGIELLIDRVHIKVNRAFCKITGYSEEELVGRSTRMLYADEEEFNRVGTELYGQMNREGQGILESRIKRKDGAVIEVLFYLSPFDPQNISAGVTVTVLDITERKRDEEEIKRIKVAVDSTSEAIGMSTAGGIHFYQNDAFDRLFGYTADELASLSPKTVYKNKDVADEVFAYIMSGKSWHGEIEMVDRNGRCFPVALRADAVKDENGKVTGLIGVHTDITERKRAEEALRESEEKYRSIFNNAAEGIFQISIVGKLLNANLSFAEILGYSSVEEMMNQNDNIPDFYLNPEDKNFIRNQISEKGLVKGYEFQLKKKNGEKAWASINIHRAIDKTGNMNIVEGTITDISMRKQIEAENSRLREMLLHSQKIESVGRLAGGIAHDFNNMLTAILGNTEMAMQLLDPEGEAYRLLTTVQKAGEGAAALTKQLLAFSRKQIIEPKLLNLNDLIERISKVLITLIGETIVLRLNFYKDIFIIKADPGYLEQIIINLAANARDAMPDGGSLIIETANILIDRAYCENHPYISPGEYVMMAISDTGCGMNDEVKSHLYEPFFTTKEKGKGTGLGLATVYGIVKQNGGTIEAYSEPDKGTTFKIYFPKAPEKISDLPAGEFKEKLLDGIETILLVEDHAQVLEFTRDSLMGLGYNVLTAASGEEALKVSDSCTGEINLLITDVILPGMNGRATADALASLRPELRVLYTSGYTAEAIDKQGVLEQGLNFISKPYSGQALAARVREILDKK